MDKITFKVNGVEYSVGSDVNSDTMLVDYLRTKLELRGTKYMCREGGCGACIVAAAMTPGGTPMSVNSCLVSVMSCHGWEITTIEAVGNRHDGYHPIQKTIAQGNGTQCGYCSPGWVMAMYSLLKNKKDISMLEIEKSFGSNICRCTGYRPIMEAFKKFAKDNPQFNDIPDIEDLYECEKSKTTCNRKVVDDHIWQIVNKEDVNKSKLEIILKDGKLWYTVDNMNDVFNIFESEGDNSYMLVSGNTAKGVYPLAEYPNILIDITRIKELKGYTLDQNLIIGAGTTLSELLEIFQNVSKNEEYFGYLEKLYEHLNLVAHIPVRNLGSIGGNLMIKHNRKEMTSDMFVLFETIGAELCILDSKGYTETMSLQKFLDTDMKRKILYKVILPPLSNEYHLETFKIMPRSQASHAIVNAGFLYKLKEDSVTDSRIVYGGLGPDFVRASETEHVLNGRKLFTNETIQAAVKSLKNEIEVLDHPPEPSVAYRKQLAINLFYKGILKLCPSKQLDPRYVSGGINLSNSRPVSKALQEFSTDPKVYPLNQPVPKIEALIQCAGEAEYSDDVPSFKREVYAVYVTSTVAVGDIDTIDPAAALIEPGVVAFYTSVDIPGPNNFMPTLPYVFQGPEEILCSKRVKYYNQPIGIIVAETYEIAERAAKLVKIQYSNTVKPVLDVKLAKNDSTRTKLITHIPAINKGMNTSKVIKTEYTIYGQYHFCMENLTCVTRPTEQGLDVFTSSQWIDVVQNYIATSLNMPQNKIDVHLRRLGGGFGLKITRTTQLAIACSLVSHKLNRPCRFIQSMNSTMRSIGKRLPCSTNFEIGVSQRGIIQYMDYNIYEDNGYITSESIALMAIEAYRNCYDSLRWDYKCYNTNTDNPKNSYCRSPATLEHIAMTEWVMEQISYELGIDPLEVRFANLNILSYANYKEMVENLKTKSEFTDRRQSVDKFNAENRWKKRGLRWAFMHWQPINTAYFDVNLSVYHGDGSVIITHGGVEMGQGINTKAVQICAYFLKIPIEKIQIKTNTTTSAPNSFLTGGSTTSQSIGKGVEKCCKELIRRLIPIKLLLVNPTWEELVAKAFQLKVDLQVHEFVGDIVTLSFPAMGVTLAEVEIDVLTGESQILRVDLLEDVGRSISPLIDVGQVEGAFIMGVGYWTSEKLVYDPKTGEILTNRPWNYFVPLARDIPQDFRVYFRENSYGNETALGAKVTGEPPICMSVVVPFAIREAITAARLESDIPKNKWFQIDGPYTTESICMAAATNTDDFKLY